MKKLSDAELSKILHEKLSNYEAETSNDVEQELFTSIGNSRVLQARRANRISFAVGSLLLISIVFYHWPNSVEKDALPTTTSKPNTKLHSQNPFAPLEFPSKRKTTQPTSSSTPLTTLRIEDSGIISIDTTFINTQKVFERGNPQLTRENDSDSAFLTHIAKKQSNVSDTVVSKGKESTVDKSDGKFWISFGIQPFLNYKRVSPIGGDRIQLSEFGGPASLSSDRLGFKFTSSVDYQFSRNRFLGLGLAYFQFHEAFQYASSEQTKGIEPYNSIDALIQGVSISVSSRYPLVRYSKRKQYLSMNLDGQYLFSNYGTPSANKFQAMLGVGYANEWIIDRHLIRVTPTINYSLTRYSYPGVQVQPFWFGIEFAYSVGLNK